MISREESVRIYSLTFALSPMATILQGRISVHKVAKPSFKSI